MVEWVECEVNMFNLFKNISNRQHLYFKTDVARLGIYKSSAGKFGYGSPCEAINRVKVDKVWLDEDGYICVQVERRTKAATDQS